MHKRVTVKTSKLLLIIVALSLCAAIIKLGYVCINKTIDNVDLEAFANNRNTVTKSLYSSRGAIYDAQGEKLAQNVNSYTLIAYLSPTRTKDDKHPAHVVDKEATAKAIAPIIGKDEASILKILSKDSYQVEFGSAGKLNETQKEQIQDLNLPGLDFVTSTTRYYKMSTFASYLVGYAKTNDQGEINGELGIESYYNDILKGKNGETRYQQDAYGYKIANTPEYTTDATDGSDIYLTIDSNIQLICENAIKKLNDTYAVDWAIFTVMDAKTGAIVASATAPTFNPNNLSTLKSYQNPLVSYEYEPGSTMKTFSFASAIESGNYNGQETYQSGSIDVADVTIRDSNKVGWGTISYDTGFAYSSNVAATKLALKMGTKTLSKYYDELGFGKTTGIELSGEAKGDADFTYQSELATAAFGQGITVTPIQILQALSTIANDGVLLKPYLVQKIVDKNGNITYQGKRTELGQVYSKTTTDYMKKLMYDVVYNGLSPMWQPNNVTLIAKTGTAQIASPKGGYLDGDYDVIRSLAGMFPQDNPQYVIYVATKKMIGPKPEMAKVVVKAIEEIASYAKITDVNETNNIMNTPITMSNCISDDVSTMKDKLTALGLQVFVLGDGKYVINQYPLKDSVVFKGYKIFLVTNNDDYLLPNFIGWSLNDLKTYALLANLNINVNGYGYVISQDIPENTLITNDLVVNLTLQ
jgi:cell division protein FtsI/penicillin-binding protein 2